MPVSPHLWLALSPHGFGHAAMTAPVVEEMRRRLPGLRLTVQTTVPSHLLQSRYGTFAQVPRIADFGFRMLSATTIDLEASAEGYRELHARLDREIEADRAAMALDRPDLVLSNVAYVPLAAAARLGVPALALSSLNWADMYAHYLGDRPEAPAILADMRAAYHGARLFLTCTPCQDMTLGNLRPVGPVARIGYRHPLRLPCRQGGDRIGLISFGGIDHDVDLIRWPRLPGWAWLTTVEGGGGRPDMAHWSATGLSFTDLIASVDVVVGKTGYGTFSEAAMAGTPVLYVARPDWPESPQLEPWLHAHVRSLPFSPQDLTAPGLAALLQTLFAQPPRPAARPTGIAEAADLLVSCLT